MNDVQKLSGGRFQQADYSIGRYAARPPAGTSLDDVLHPTYFQNHLDSLRAGMVITVLSDDFSLDCDLRVLTVEKTAAKMRVLRMHGEGFETKAPAAIDDCEVAWAGPNHKWRFLHSGSVIEHGFATEAEARAAADKYLAKIKE